MKFSATAFQAFNTTRGNNEVALSNHFTMSYELTTNSKTERDVVVGTMLNRLFRYLSLQKQTGARFANLSHPVLLKFNVGKTTIDMRDIEERLQATFKVGHTPKAKRTFALRIRAVVEFLLEQPVEVSVEDLLAGLEEQIAGDMVAELTA